MGQNSSQKIPALKQYVSKSSNTIYQTTCDVLVVAQTGSSASEIFDILTDTFTPPTTAIARVNSAGSGWRLTMSCLIPKGNYWKVNPAAGTQQVKTIDIN